MILDFSEASPNLGLTNGVQYSVSVSASNAFGITSATVTTSATCPNSAGWRSRSLGADVGDRVRYWKPFEQIGCHRTGATYFELAFGVGFKTTDHEGMPDR